MGQGRPGGPQWPRRLQASRVSELSIPRWSLHSCENRKAAPSTNTGGTGETREPAANQQQEISPSTWPSCMASEELEMCPPLRFVLKADATCATAASPFSPVFTCQFWTSESCGCRTLCGLDSVLSWLLLSVCVRIVFNYVMARPDDWSFSQTLMTIASVYPSLRVIVTQLQKYAC